ncbi:SPFH domain-containing protein [Streptomyces odonnellii]|uniref:SPFH domain-containing protein n=1 Tax=Streptomyces odonnellii TaxID=1417980 RepID=UPI001E3DB009|nr:SPFH domain-containing protein [Streptomyces odonnellii]
MLVPWAGLCVVPAGHVGIVHKRIGKAHPDQRFRRITPHDARGVQARALLPGRLHWLTPFIHSVEFVPRIHVPAGHIGLVVATEGAKRAPGRVLGRYVECDSFQDGPAFLLGGGEQGRQLAFLRGDSSYYINTALFQVEVVPRTYVEPGTVGLVIAKDGAIRPPDRPFGRYVECDSFQDGPAFLLGGGEQGRQLAILTGGTHYDINPYLFEVITNGSVGRSARGGSDGLGAGQLKEIAIPVGHAGVVITLDGAEPDRAERRVGPIVKGHSSFRLPWVFLGNGGWRGVQEETLGEGSVYALNPWFVRVVLIPTRLLILDWSNKNGSQSDNNYDAALDRISVNVQGHRLQVELRQTLNIPETAAPRLVSEFGDSSTSGVGGLVNNPAPVQRFVERVLGGAVDTYFNGIAAESTVEEFLTRYASIRTDLAAQVRNALAGWGVEAASTNLGEFESLDDDLDKARKRVFEAQTHTQELEEQKKSAHIKAEIQQIELAAEREHILLDVVKLERKIELLGRDTIAMQFFLAELKHMKVPQIVSGDAESLLQYLPMQRALEIIDGAKLRAEQSALPQSAPADQDHEFGDGGTE